MATWQPGLVFFLFLVLIDDVGFEDQSNNALNSLDLETLYMRRENLCLKFAQKCVRNKKTKHMFPLKNKTHKMEIRNTEKFKVQYANTERLKDSSIPYMQHLLNDYEAKKTI